MGTFDERIADLMDRVGDGEIVASVVVDQVYARYQHEGLDFKHPGGGKAMFLHDPAFSEAPGALRKIARELHEQGPQAGMRGFAEDVSQGVYEQAPFEFGDLKASPHPTVKDDGSTIYDRRPLIHRLTRDELRIKGYLRNLGLGNR